MIEQDTPKDQRARQILIAELRDEGIDDEAVLAAINAVPRHLFVDESAEHAAYFNIALGIGCDQTISQPYVVGRMTQMLLHDHPAKKVLEIGTGSGYQSSILAHLVDKVYSVERHKPLCEIAKKRLALLNLTNVSVLHGDGMQGWAAHAPYDGIIVTAGAQTVPQPLLDQLADQGRLIIPVGDSALQTLQLITRDGDDYHYKNYDAVVFVPLLPGKEA